MEGTLYFPPRLTEKFDQLRSCPLSALEAPAGYGKTTAVRRAMRDQPGEICWHTAVQSLPDSSFRWFVQQISRVNESIAQKLTDLGYLNRSNADTAAKILLNLRVDTPLTLIFDNFQFTVANWQPQVIDSLAKRPRDGLHVIFLSQYFDRLQDVLKAQGEEICYISQQDLLMTESDIRAFAEQIGLGISQEEIQSVSRKTGGWAAAVAMILQELQTGKKQPGEVGGMEEILEQHFWSGLSRPVQESLLRICMFDRLTIQDTVALNAEKPLNPEELQQMIRKTPLVFWHELRHELYPHEILISFLRDHLDMEDDTFRKTVYRNSGKLYRSKGRNKEAVNCFYLAGDDEGILSCRLVCLLTEKFEGTPYAEVARHVLKRSSDELLARYPLSALRLCYALYAGCDFDGFERQMRRLYAILEKKNDPQLMGEWYLMDALEDFPDLDGMERKYRKAEELMDDPSEIFIREEPFMFGCSSMWYLFYAKPGTMLETADRFARVLKVYNRLTNDHGAGEAEIYRGEAYSVQGRFEESDIQAYQAAFLSEQAGNVTGIYGVALLLGINAIYRSDLIGLQKAIDYLENKAQSQAFLQGSSLGAYMVETVRGYLLGLMMEPSRSALWTQGEADSLTDLTFTTFMTKTCRITDLMLKKEYKKAIASVETSLELDSRLISTPTRNFMYCGLSLCYLAIGRMLKAAQYLDKSLELAGQDQNYTFLACFRKYFQVLFMMPQIASKHSKTIHEIKALDIRYSRSDESHIFAMLEEGLNEKEKLTDRERDVAELAAQGLHNNEIAERLCISENTVKRHLKSAFQKLNVDRRSRLIEMLR